MRDYAALFFGAFVQCGLATIMTRYVVLDSPLGVGAAVFLGQSLWWVNIQRTTRDGRASRWLAWTSGAALGAAAGLCVCGIWS